MNAMDGALAPQSFDPFDLNKPHANWAAFREGAPIFFHEASGYWVVSRYDEIKTIFDDWKTFSSENVNKPAVPTCEAALKVLKDGNFTAYSGLTSRVPPEHTRIRKVAQSCFGPRRFKTIQPQIGGIVERHLDTLEAKGKNGPVDFWREVAYPVPAFVLFTLMGIPEEDVPKIKKYGESRAMLTFGDLDEAGQVEAAHDMVAYWNYIDNLVSARENNPGDDFPSDLLRMQAEGADISRDEIKGLMFSTLFAGHETTSTLMGNAVITFMQNRGAWDAIKEDHAKIPNAIEEILRHSPSVTGWRRKARHDAQIGGAEIKAGDEILMITGSANRDEAQFPDGETFDISRPNARTHLSFGYGIHYCLGFQLAKMEGQVVLEQLTRRFPDMTLAEGFEAQFLRNLSFRVPTSVIVNTNV
ncbi:cytochrome P450 [Maritimibacter sp. DP1N21-5]|uniref:cytochrome P450 n=1 Tax=Maritimibacter sp. DP1N21-5 TaxID=2836867 RepID=UPI00210202BA|nr:cytochrome P450 [Maritimibacter sp. DP1N21-5]